MELKDFLNLIEEFKCYVMKITHRYEDMDFSVSHFALWLSTRENLK